eukprot:IDg10956t1
MNITVHEMSHGHFVSDEEDCHAWKVVNSSEISHDVNIIGARFNLPLNNVGTDLEKAKARFVGQGFKDAMKNYIVHSSPTLRQSLTKLILSVAAVLKYNVAMVRPADCSLIGITEGQLLELKKPLYGICDSGDYWSATFESFFKNELNMVPSLVIYPSISLYRHRYH